MSERSGGSLRLLASYARPFAGALAIVFVLNAVGALLQQGSYLLLQPTWTLLFGDPDAEDPALAEARARLEALRAEDPSLPLDGALEALTPAPAPAPAARWP